MPPLEPTLARLSSPLPRYLLATRPAFLSVTLVACLIGLACAARAGAGIDVPAALVTVLFALVAHAAVNVINDWADARNGTDAINTERVFPFTGGSRFIQNGVIDEARMRAFACVLFASVTAAGLWLAYRTTPWLIAVGAAGLFVGWAYSVGPFRLNSRGLGEPCVTAGFLLLAVGSDLVQRGAPSADPVVAALPYALLVTNVLYINQFPDRRADAQAGKHHWVVRLGPLRARWGYLGLAALAYALLVLAVGAGRLPATALAGLAGLPLSVVAACGLWRDAAQPARLAPAIRATIGAALLHGGGIALTLAL
ncbi:MAG TPA: prenyltransferase [Quisquiliibacterium sp.]|nr:prenyltransferase [Quisquiliibacterium sp.]